MVMGTGDAAKFRRRDPDVFDFTKDWPITSIITYTPHPGEASETFVFTGVYTLPFSVHMPVPIPTSSNLASQPPAQSVVMLLSLIFSLFLCYRGLI